jgi:hypothetical protein
VGSRPKPRTHLVERSKRTSSPRITRIAGEHARPASPLSGVACSTAELRKWLSPLRKDSNPRPCECDATDLFATGEQDWRGTYDAVHALGAELCDSRDSNPFGAEAPYREVTVIFTTAAPARRARTLKELGNGRSRSSPSKRGALLAKRSQPATHRLSRSRFHGTIERRRDSNPHCHCCEVSEIFTTSVRSLSRRSEKPRGRGSPGGTVESRWPEGLRWGRSNETHHHPEL